MRRSRTAAYIGCCLAATAATACAASIEYPKSQFGQPVAALTFKDIHYLPRSLDDLGHPKVWALVFTTTQCPVAQRYLPRLQELSDRYADKGVQFLAVNVGAEDSIQDVAYQAIQFHVTFPFLKDMTGDAARTVGATRTPEVVLLDGDKRLRYRGRIDDQYRLGGVREKAEHQELIAAIEDVLAEREPAVKETPVDGCAIAFLKEAAADAKEVKEAKEAKEAPTFARDVAPIVYKQCAGCHHPGTEAPFSLLSYRDGAAHAETIAEVVSEGRMPPWFAHPDFGKFANERRLSPEERDTIARWVKTGAAAGDLTQAPQPPIFTDSKWTIGQPDKIVTALLAEHVPASGIVPYRYIVLPYLFPYDTWVQGIEIMPENPKVVHHANLGFVKLGEKFDESRNFLTGRVPGGSPMDLHDGTALMIPKGSVIGLEVHYVTTGKEETDRISVGLRFAKEPVLRQVHYLHMTRTRFAIPHGAPAFELREKKTLPCDATGIGLFTHMHLRGKDTTFIAHHPDGRDETLLSVPNYSFDWQSAYHYARGAERLPKGTVIEAISHFDNSSFNPFNPDPTRTVHWGPQTFDEMMDNFFFYTDDAESLQIRVDPKTGKALALEPEKPAGTVAE